MKAEILIKVTMSNIIDAEGLAEYYGGSLEKCVKDMIADEGHYFGLVDDHFEIVSVKEIA